MKQVVVYHQPGCAACHQAMDYLKQRGVAFVEKNVQEDRAALVELIQMRLSTTPVILIDGTPIEGFDAARLEAALAARE
jgi:glutaredoxin